MSSPAEEADNERERSPPSEFFNEDHADLLLLINEPGVLDYADETQFYGLDVPDAPDFQIDDDIQYLPETDLQNIAQASRGRSRVSDDYEWTDRYISDVGEPVIFNLDSSVKDAWSLFQVEINFIRKRIRKLIAEHKQNNENENNENLLELSLPICSPRDDYPEVSLDDIFEFCIGTSSSFANSICKELQMNKETYLRFMGTVCAQMAYKQSPAGMFDSDSLLFDKMIMKSDTYVSLWEGIAELKKVSSNEYFSSSRREDCLWKIFQTVINSFLRDISIATNTDGISNALDDDKIWVESSGKNAEDAFGLRGVTHVKDNRKGIIAHVSGSSLTNLNNCFIFEEKGSTAVSCYREVFNTLFPSLDNARDALPDLDGVMNYSDRGYTIAETVFDFLLAAGADFNNTVKRIAPFPFVWDMKVAESDKRTLLDARGGMTLFLKEIVKYDRLVTCSAFRTGTKNISTIITTKYHGFQWEGVCLNTKHRIIYEEDPYHGLDSFIFERLAATKPYINNFEAEIKTMLDDLLQLKIDALTLEQGTACWHMGRKFSSTSSQANGAFNTAFVIYQKNEDWCNVAKYLFGITYYKCKSHKTYFYFIYSSLNLTFFCLLAFDGVTDPELTIDDTSDDEGSDDVGGDGGGDSGGAPKSCYTVGGMVNYFNGLDTNGLPEEETEAIAIICDRINNQNGQVAGFVGPPELLGNAKADVRQAIMNKLSERIPENDRKRNNGLAYFKKWLKAKNEARVFMFQTKDALIRIAAETSRGMVLRSQLTYDAMIEKLVEFFKELAGPLPDSDSGADQDNDEAAAVAQAQDEAPHPQSASIKQEIIKAQLTRSFMRPLKGVHKEHCEMGHKVELPIALDWIRDVHEKNLFHGFKFKIIALYKVGLVSKKLHPWAKDSIDFLAFILNEENDSLEMWGVEIKSRQSTKTINKEREFNRRTRQDRKYLKADAHDVHKFIANADERWQILHHAYVYGLERVAHIIGTRGGKVMSGTVVNFENFSHAGEGNSLLASYEKVIDEIKDISLFYAYSNQNAEDVIIPDDVLKIAETVPTINGNETLYGQLKLWKVMFDDTSILPRPALKRILPSTHAKWNVSKGCSDTITKLVDTCFIKPPRIHTNFQSVAVGRCMSNLLATTFKLYQIHTADSDISVYPSMSHYRNAASHRFTFQKFLSKAYYTFKARADEASNNNVLENSMRVVSPVRQVLRPRRVRFQNGGIPKLMDFAVPKTFNTPVRSRKQMIDNGVASEEILKRTKNCTGFIVEVLSQDEQEEKEKDPRRSCIVCGKHTRWQCAGCHFYYCLTVLSKDDLYYNLEKKSASSSATASRVFRRTCYHAYHEDAIRCRLLPDGKRIIE